MAQDAGRVKRGSPTGPTPVAGFSQNVLALPGVFTYLASDKAG
jgi:hypothetical protein